MSYAFIVSTVLITLAEFGDKTQILALALAVRYKASKVLLGVFLATLLVHLFSTLVGHAVGSIIPRAALAIATGLLFIGFGVWTLHGDRGDGGADRPARFGPVLTTGIAFFLAELGDKTQIMTMTIAADPGAAARSVGGLFAGIGLQSGASPWAVMFGVWMGSTLGMVIADGVAILVGAVLGKKLPERLITRISGALFILFGVATLVAQFVQWGVS